MVKAGDCDFAVVGMKSQSECNLRGNLTVDRVKARLMASQINYKKPSGRPNVTMIAKELRASS